MIRVLKSVCAAVVALSVAACQAHGAGLGFRELARRTASDAVHDDLFGRSVDISAGTAIVGATFDDDAGLNSGSAYLLDVTTGNQLFKLTAGNAAAGDQFGGSVALSGGTAIVGAELNDEVADNSGSAYLFDVATGNQLLKLTAFDAAADDRFGHSVGISGGTAIVGSYIAGQRSGSAYLFDAATGNLLLKLNSSDSAPQDLFGFSVDISGGIAIVGAWRDDAAGQDSGAAYLFDADPSSPTFGDELFKLTASDAAAGDLFGSSVAIDGDTAIVGAYLNSDTGSYSGSAYLFDVATGSQLAKLTASDAAAGDFFGAAVGISAGTAIVAAEGNDDAGGGSGSAYLFDVTTGNQLAKLTASDASAGDRFGYSLAIDGGTAIVGAFLDDNVSVDAGSAYLFGLPEPSSFLLAILALVGLVTYGWRRRA